MRLLLAPSDRATSRNSSDRRALERYLFFGNAVIVMLDEAVMDNVFRKWVLYPTTQLQNRGAVATGSSRATINKRQNLIFLQLELYRTNPIAITQLQYRGAVATWSSRASIDQRQHLVFLQLEWY